MNIKDTSSSTIIFTIAVGIIMILLFAGIITFQNTEAVEGEEEKEETIYKNRNNYLLPELFRQVQQSVVQISSSEENIGNKQLGSRLGSGFIYDKNGHVITDYHVVNGGGNELLVTFPDGSIYNGEIVGLDPYSDLAVLKINTVPQEKLKPLVFGNSSNLVIGQHVAAVGNPFGLLGSMTEGIVSGLGRLLPSSITTEPLFGSEIAIIGSFSIPDTIQTDAAINPGNSGGPLLNMKGEVIGINSAIFSNTGVYAGVGFAIPSNMAKKVVPALIEKGSYDHPWLGIIGADITPAIAEEMNLTEAKGFLVTDVRANSPADKAGIKGGDIIVTINNDSREVELGGDIIIGIDGKPVRKIDDILTHIAREKLVGDQVTFTLIRNGETLEEKTLTLEKRPDSENIFKIGKKQYPSLGVTGIDVNSTIADAMNLTEAKGFLVTDVRANSPADKAGIQGGYKIEIINNTQYRLGGDVIVGIDNETIYTVEDIKNYINTKNEEDIVNLKVIRDEEMKNIKVKLEVITNNNEPLDFFNQFNPFEDDEDKDSQKDFFENQQLPFLEDLEEQCLQTFNHSICNFLFK